MAGKESEFARYILAGRLSRSFAYTSTVSSLVCFEFTLITSLVSHSPLALHVRSRRRASDNLD